ncbi:MAG: preprotein translocase subunit SecG [Chlamydiae bacterium]|nr:preprotein translocase subunit SecG [Chlamydiota bacterium]MBI3267323.1 preprotein translocase subunit SecG [Chlamydiota bacterium]
MTIFLIVLHVVCCLGLIAIVLLQAGKGAGLASTFGAAAVETALGAGASDFLKTGTSLMAIVFMITSLALAFMTARQSSSVVKNVRPTPVTTEIPMDVSSTAEQGSDALKGKSKAELQNILKQMTQALPLGNKTKSDTSTTPSTQDAAAPSHLEEKNQADTVPTQS